MVFFKIVALYTFTITTVQKLRPAVFVTRDQVCGVGVLIFYNPGVRVLQIRALFSDFYEFDAVPYHFGAIGLDIY